MGSPHEGIVMEIGKKDTDVKREVIDWRQFDWPAYKSLTGDSVYFKSSGQTLMIWRWTVWFRN